MTGVLELTMTDDLAALRPLDDGQRLDDVTVRALDLVIDANGDLDVWFAIGTGALEGRFSSVQRMARRAGVELVASHRVSDGLVAEEHRIDQGQSAPGGEQLARRARALVRSWTEGA
jgi:hypothetical protein